VRRGENHIVVLHYIAVMWEEALCIVPIFLIAGVLVMYSGDLVL